jgi:hypothetical protein
VQEAREQEVAARRQLGLQQRQQTQQAPPAQQHQLVQGDPQPQGLRRVNSRGAAPDRRQTWRPRGQPLLPQKI